jgi:hypothetical protein
VLQSSSVIDCPFRTEQGTCKIVDDGVGSPVEVPENACKACIETHPEPELRHLSSPVESWTWIGLRRQGKKTPPLKKTTVFNNPQKTTRPNRCEDLGRELKRVSGCACPRKSVYNCDRFADANNNPLQVIPNGQCESCPNYVDSQEKF